LNDFIKRLKQTGSITRKSGSGRPRTAQTTAKVDVVDELVLSQEDDLQTHSTVRQIARETRIHLPDSTPVRQQHQCWRSFALFLVRFRNDLYCVGWGVKLYSLTPALFWACHYQTFLLSIQFISNA